MKNQIRGSVKINVAGKNLYGFINELHKRRINCFGQYVKGGIFCAEVYRHDLKKMCALADEMSVELKSFEQKTFSAEVIKRRGRYGIIVGIMLVIAASLYFSGVIVTIDIQGNERISDEIILSALEEIDIKSGTPFGQIDYIYSENQLRLMVDGISWAGMHRTGHRLVVEVTEIVEKPDMLHDRIPCNITSSHDAEILYTSVLDGMLMHKVGDYVMAGDILVTGVTSDSTGRVTLHHAMGNIIGKYEETVDFEGEFTKESAVFTGETDTRRRLKLLNLEIPLYFGKNKYDYRECEITDKPLTVFGKTLPISIEKTVYREIKRMETTLDEEELEKSLMEKVYLYEKNFLQDCEIIDRKITKNKSADSLILSVKYTLKGDICTQKEILVK